MKIYISDKSEIFCVVFTYADINYKLECSYDESVILVNYARNELL